ncbi:MAG TPA: hypothetical protein VJZ71_17420 [Phycisphaerae bacterium]|nr:hypothetical protein [Phycisphaerae bacterium]
MNRQFFLAVAGFDNAKTVRRRTARPVALLVALHKAVASPLRQHAAVIRRDDQLHAAGQRVRAFGDTYYLDTVLFQIFDQNVRFGGAAEAIKLVDVEPGDASGFRFLHQPEQFRPAAGRPARLGFVDEMLERLTRCPLAGFDLHGDACTVVLRVARIASVHRVVLAAPAAILALPPAAIPLCRQHDHDRSRPAPSPAALTVFDVRGEAPRPAPR